MHLSIIGVPRDGAALHDHLRVVPQEPAHQPPVPVHSDEGAVLPLHSDGLPLLLLRQVPFCSFLNSRLLDSDVVGMISGHIYYYFSDILPKIAKVRGWKRTTFIEAPSFLHISIPFVTHRCWLLQGIGDEYDIEEPIPEELLTEELPEAAIAPDDESSSPEDEDEVRQRHSSVSYKHAQLKDELNAESNLVVAAVQVRRVHRQ